MCGSQSQTITSDPIYDNTLIEEFDDDWYDSLCDAHCHLHDDQQLVNDIPIVRTGHLTLMGVRLDDWTCVEEVTAACNNKKKQKAVPCFGIHPWYTYRLETEDKKRTDDHYQSILEGPDDTEKQELISHLPPPTPFEEWYHQLKQHLLRHPTALLGEVGLDRAARLLPKGAIEWHGVKPTNVICHIDHQYAILQQQIQLAVDLDRAVSIHCVQSQGHLLKLLQWTGRYIKQGSKSTELRVCLHSFGGKAASLNQFLKLPHIVVYVSFSIAINARLGWSKLSQLIQTIPDDHLLIESDYNTPQGVDQAMVHIASLVARAKNWSLHDTVLRTERNWLRFTGLDVYNK
ncbi:TatD family [Halteromyces radiatus]|uniref:TatD family n=1 Tax=Halteromyces radiatus TaxID=101107 RepID=UPI00221F7F4A|nr:TatD family [Halteromyces radiatus]KAI8082777.1 TatD family [Halteromyces radiatus]